MEFNDRGCGGHTEGGKIGITIRRITKIEDMNETKANMSAGMRRIMVGLNIV